MRLISLTRTYQVGALVFFAGQIYVEDEIYEELMQQKLGHDIKFTRLAMVETHSEPPRQGTIHINWKLANIGDRIHVDHLLRDIHLMKFYSQDGEVSFCDTPISTFSAYRYELPWYTRIE